jgi:NDP-sugar pyrophosphorylase family protein
MLSGRLLTPEEIAQLQTQRCQAEDWSRIRVSEDFTARTVTETIFSGDIFMGCFGKKLMLPGGVPVESGIYKAHLHNCQIADNVYISHVSLYIANYSIGEGTVIENIGALYTEGESSFGNGTSVSVLDETGGRAVPIYEGLSAQTAYMTAMNAHRPLLTAAVNKLVQEYARSVRSAMGRVGASCSIRNSGTLRNLRIGDGCEIDGASMLVDGSLCSSPSAFQGDNNEPLLTAAYVGANVIAKHFIFAPGSVVKDGVRLERCFVGEAAELSNGFSAHDSLFFANCQMENGEACASFAGPYTVSMHKSTLLVGGMFSFCNFGSGTNQSNHFYKLGPMHSGVCERGCKTGSDAYILWPGKIGAFTFIKGRHNGNPDTTDFPFSYLMEDNGKSYLSPGASLRSVGSLRDELKWPQRDKRTSLKPADKLCFEVSNPFTAYGIDRGLEQMKQLVQQTETTEFALTGCYLKKSSLIKGRKLYQTALDIYKGGALIRRLESLLEETELMASLTMSGSAVSEGWSDLSGLLVPDNKLGELLHLLEKGDCPSIAALEESWEKLYRNYPDFAWQSVLQRLILEWDKPASALKAADFLPLIDVWESSLTAVYKHMLSDAELELTMMHRYGTGEKRPDHPFLKVLQKLLDEIPLKASRCKAMLNRVNG